MGTSLPDPLVFAAVIAAAAVTYLLRTGGLYLAQRLPKAGAVHRFMTALPGTILLSLIAPSILREGPVGGVSAALVVFLVRKTKNVFVAMAAGTLLVALCRRFL